MGPRDAFAVLTAFGAIVGAITLVRALIAPMIAGLFDRRH